MTQEPAQKMKKERETKDDGRYIIFYTFNGEGKGESTTERGDNEA